jgi:DNA polymerase III epsilon subunit-like protein
MNYRDIIVFDFETGSRNPDKTQPVQIAAVAIHGRKLTVQPEGYFESLIRPILDDEEAIEKGLDPIEDEALAVNGKTREELAKAPAARTVWKKFANFVNRYNFKGTPYYAPVAAGYNIVGFDMPIVQRMCEQYGPTDKKTGKQVLFNKIHRIDVMDNVWMWMENNADVKSLSMDSMRDLFGISKENAHDALQDVKDTANLMIGFMKLHRRIAPKIKFEKAFAAGNLHI